MLATALKHENRGLQLPVAFCLSPRVPDSRAAAFRQAVLARPQAFSVIEEDAAGAVHVLVDFGTEEYVALEQRSCQIMGLPLAERILRDPAAASMVRSLPAYDFVFRSELQICCSSLTPFARKRCSILTQWLGAKFSPGLDSETGLLVTSRVSLHPDSKYQAAIAGRVPIVLPSYLENMWQTKRQESVDVRLHAIPALKGLGICFDPLNADILERYRARAVSNGAEIEPLDRAEVVIVKDVFVPLYQEARKVGILAAPPRWLDRCFELQLCTPITGDLEVLHPTSARLSAPPAGCDALVACDPASDVGGYHCGTVLLGCVICLLYLPVGPIGDAAKTLAWRCGAFTTLDPNDPAITHVLFRVLPTAPVIVSVPVDEDRVCFLDISWLEACCCEGKRVKESLHLQQRVLYNPPCDAAWSAVSGRVRKPVASSQVPVARARSLDGSVKAPLPLPTPEESPLCSGPLLRVPARGEGGVFAGLTIGVLGWRSDDPELVRVSDKICNATGTVLHGGETPDEMIDARIDVCLCRDGARPQFCARPPTLVSVHWVDACLADGVRHDQSFPHFAPSPSLLPLNDMAGCAVRITALERSREAPRKRARLGELVQLLGARVMQQDNKASEITHIVCVVPELLDSKRFEELSRKGHHVVSVQWLLDCYSRGSRQLEKDYDISGLRGKAEPPSQASVESVPAQEFAATVLTGFTVLVSLLALGSNSQLLQMAEELGTTAQTWRTVDELRELFDASGVPKASPKTSEGEAPGVGDGSGTATARQDASVNLVVLVEKEEARAASGALAEYCSALTAEHRAMFVLPAWLAETYSQRRCQPLEAFAALSDVPSAKRPRLDEATYAWQSAASTRLEELAEVSKARVLESKAQKKVNEGLRLAELSELRRAPQRSGA